MKKVLLVGIMVVATLGAAEGSNNKFSMCEIAGKGFGDSYAYSQSNLAPEQFCDAIVKSKSNNELMCSFKDLTAICVNQIKAKQK
jgi:hypothetical protein